jgi:hypothetical protein
VRYVLISFISIVLFNSCTTEEVVEEPKCQEVARLNTLEATDISETTATLNGSISPPDCYSSTMISQGFVVNDSGLPTIADLVYKRGGSELSVEIDGLRMNDEYFVRMFYEDQNGVVYGNEISFKTSIGAVGFLPSSYSDVTPISATVYFTGSTAGGGSISEIGIVYSTNSEPTVDDFKLVTDEFYGSFKLENLTSDTAYYFRPFGVNEVGLFYGEEMSFTTLDGKVEFELSFSKIKKSGFEYSYEITNDGGYGDLITSEGIFFYATSAATGERIEILSEGVIGGLNTDTAYYAFPFYVVNEEVEFLLEPIEIITAPLSINAEIKRVELVLESPGTHNSYGDYYGMTGIDADIFIDTKLKYIKEARLEMITNYGNGSSYGLARIFWKDGVNYGPLTLEKIEELEDGTYFREMGKGQMSGSRIYINDGDGKYDYNYAVRVKITDFSDNIYYSEIVPLEVPDFNP